MIAADHGIMLAAGQGSVQMDGISIKGNIISSNANSSDMHLYVGPGNNNLTITASRIQLYGEASVQGKLGVMDTAVFNGSLQVGGPLMVSRSIISNEASGLSVQAHQLDIVSTGGDVLIHTKEDIVFSAPNGSLIVDAAWVEGAKAEGLVLMASRLDLVGTGDVRVHSNASVVLSAPNATVWIDSSEVVGTRAALRLYAERLDISANFSVTVRSNDAVVLAAPHGKVSVESPLLVGASPDGLTVHTNGSLALESRGNGSITAVGDVMVSAGGRVKVEAADFAMVSAGNLTLRASAGVSVLANISIAGSIEVKEDAAFHGRAFFADEVHMFHLLNATGPVIMRGPVYCPAPVGLSLSAEHGFMLTPGQGSVQIDGLRIKGGNLSTSTNDSDLHISTSPGNSITLDSNRLLVNGDTRVQRGLQVDGSVQVDGTLKVTKTITSNDPAGLLVQARQVTVQSDKDMVLAAPNGSLIVASAWVEGVREEGLSLLASRLDLIGTGTGTGTGQSANVRIHSSASSVVLSAPNGSLVVDSSWIKGARAAGLVVAASQLDLVGTGASDGHGGGVTIRANTSVVLSAPNGSLMLDSAWIEGAREEGLSLMASRLHLMATGGQPGNVKVLSNASIVLASAFNGSVMVDSPRLQGTRVEGLSLEASRLGLISAGEVVVRSNTSSVVLSAPSGSLVVDSARINATKAEGLFVTASRLDLVGTGPLGNVKVQSNTSVVLSALNGSVLIDSPWMQGTRGEGLTLLASQLELVGTGHVDDVHIYSEAVIGLSAPRGSLLVDTPVVVLLASRFVASAPGGLAIEALGPIALRPSSNASVFLDLIEVKGSDIRSANGSDLHLHAAPGNIITMAASSIKVDGNMNVMGNGSFRGDVGVNGSLLLSRNIVSIEPQGLSLEAYEINLVAKGGSPGDVLLHSSENVVLSAPNGSLVIDSAWVQGVGEAGLLISSNGNGGLYLNGTRKVQVSSLLGDLSLSAPNGSIVLDSPLVKGGRAEGLMLAASRLDFSAPGDVRIGSNMSLVVVSAPNGSLVVDSPWIKGGCDKGLSIMSSRLDLVTSGNVSVNSNASVVLSAPNGTLWFNSAVVAVSARAIVSSARQGLTIQSAGSLYLESAINASVVVDSIEIHNSSIRSTDEGPISIESPLRLLSTIQHQTYVNNQTSSTANVTIDHSSQPHGNVYALTGMANYTLSLPHCSSSLIGTVYFLYVEQGSALLLTENIHLSVGLRTCVCIRKSYGAFEHVCS